MLRKSLTSAALLVLLSVPSVCTIFTRDTRGELQDCELQPTFDLQLTRMPHFRFERSQRFERFQHLEFRNNYSRLLVSSEWSRRMALFSFFSRGSGINYYPAPGIAPFLRQSERLNVGTVFRPGPQLIVENPCILSRLRQSGGAALPGHEGPVSVFNNHLARTKLNYQFTLSHSPQTILDYNSILPNPCLVSLEEKRLAAGVLLT